MKKLTRKIVALTLSLVMCISFSNTTIQRKQETVLVHGKHSLFQLRHTNGSCIMPIITMPMLVQVFL